MAAETPLTSERRSRLRRVPTWVIVGLAILVYAASLLGYYVLHETSHGLGEPDLGTTADTVVVINLVAMHTVENQLDVKVLVLPKDSLMDERLNVLNTDISVRLYPQSSLEDLQYPQGKTPSQLNTTITTTGNADIWPFDSYATKTISADVLVGTGTARQFQPARVEVDGSLNGWDIRSTRSGPATQSTGEHDDVSITLHRAKSPFGFGLLICEVLISLPAMALFVSIETLRVKRRFMPAYATWYTAMLFAIVPLRNFLPGAPPAGAWIDQVIVAWCLVALVLAMILFIVAWRRSED